MRKIFELYAPCHFGLEAVLKKEIIDIGYDITKVEDGRVYFEGDDEAVARANMWLRTTERVMNCSTRSQISLGKNIFLSTENFGSAKPPQSKANSSHLRIFSPS